QHVRRELRERHHADVERRVRQLEDEPAERDPLHPRAGLGDDLSPEEEAVVAVAEAVERALRGSRQTPGSPPSGRRRGGPPAAPTAASSSGVSAPRRLASHAVRRERTRRSARWPPSVSVSPVQRRSASLLVRATRPSRSSRETRFDIAAVETRSSSASRPTVMPGVYLIATSKLTWGGETPAILSRRSSRARRSSVGRRLSATAIASRCCCVAEVIR